ncbi:hypothetical protein [Brevibacillus brevis]|uniref:Uncharacterized protein n=1 Tax=Brevibacillus brevis TaxID=1393 RepID=A0ABY9T1X7_BREBE|nr:hypothetical protein [Brevibacillus brevis]WNC12957.1 hypothetical protein RGB73_19805 [Brevibacillus brevis]
MRNIIHYCFAPIAPDALLIGKVVDGRQKTGRLVLTALMSVLAALLQSAGGFFPGIGYPLSMLSTAPILICTIHSPFMGGKAFLLTNLLLLLIQPTEIPIFAGTTGVLGIGLGMAFLYCRRRILMAAFNALLLLGGIAVLTFLVGIPVLGPEMASAWSLRQFLLVYASALLYCLFWVEIGMFLVGRIKRSIGYFGFESGD